MVTEPSFEGEQNPAYRPAHRQPGIELDFTKRTPNGWSGEQFEASPTQQSVSLGAAWRIGSTVTTPDETLLREVLHDLIVHR
jgi:hypothetical protein